MCVHPFSDAVVAVVFQEPSKKLIDPLPESIPISNLSLDIDSIRENPPPTPPPSGNSQKAKVNAKLAVGPGDTAMESGWLLSNALARLIPHPTSVVPDRVPLFP